MKEIVTHIENHVDEYVAELKRLCSQPSISPENLGLSEMAELCEETMRAYGLQTRLLPTPGGPPVVYGERQGRSPKTLLVYHHYDVQTVDPLDAWQSPPFQPKVRDGKLYGRGVVDNKGAFMTRLAAIKAFLDVYGELPVSVKFFVEGEEEVGSPHLIPLLEANLDLLAADACLWSGEVTGQHRPKITLGLKGYLHLELEVRGANREIHSAAATSIVNPAWRLVWALASLKDIDENILVEGFGDDVLPPTGADLHALRRIPSEEEQIKESLGISDFLLGLSGFERNLRDVFSPSLNIFGIQSGYTGEGSKTVLPSVARAGIDVRLVPDMDPADVLTKLRRHLDRRGFGDVSVNDKWGRHRKAWRTPVDDPFAGLVIEAAREAYGTEPVVYPIMNSAGIMILFGTYLGVPIATSGTRYPGSQIHAPNENVRLDDFVACIKHVATVLDKMGSTGE